MYKSVLKTVAVGSLTLVLNTATAWNDHHKHKKPKPMQPNTPNVTQTLSSSNQNTNHIFNKNYNSNDATSISNTGDQISTLNDGDQTVSVNNGGNGDGFDLGDALALWGVGALLNQQPAHSTMQTNVNHEGSCGNIKSDYDGWSLFIYHNSDNESFQEVPSLEDGREDAIKQLEAEGLDASAFPQITRISIAEYIAGHVITPKGELGRPFTETEMKVMDAAVRSDEDLSRYVNCTREAFKGGVLTAIANSTAKRKTAEIENWKEEQTAERGYIKSVANQCDAGVLKAAAIGKGLVQPNVNDPNLCDQVKEYKSRILEKRIKVNKLEVYETDLKIEELEEVNQGLEGPQEVAL